ncbi:MULTISPECIES: FAD-dependent oxidoreductase [unclassified Pseudoalteromonas]|uniref:FAD-dependent oxidoreductase n=1 Tax=unclassified Pseudoalteromonas TaxID=194690 RepID=UPI00110BBC60|nr:MULTISPECIES: FAD-dependent oxidoreductase [unclassified Pseudoalteromonas]TMP44917.1 FAD-dependent oxidoreductase [Pseudoalteromonas sp. S1650]TMP67099.1 FAD-dependent oxidoreductase [Pseudoalteromonas sp. S1649]
MQFQPFWFDNAMQEEAYALPLSLPAKHHCDVCIIGGGFTGLWTAIKLKQQQANLKVTIIEKGYCGQGASGRNGGAMLTWSTKLPSLSKLVGFEKALFLVRESESAVHQIAEFVCQHGIDCDCRIDGCYYTASNEAQKHLLAPAIKMLEDNNLNAWQHCDTQALINTGSAANISGHYSPHGGSIQPAKLVRGLKQVAESLGITIIEQCQYTAHSGQSPLNVETSQGNICANHLVFAVNAWLPTLKPQFQRNIVLVSSDMAITKPMPETLNHLSLNHGAAIIDSRIFVNYYRTTTDGRLMLGKGGNYFSFANRVSDKFEQPSRYQTLLNNSLSHFFPNHNFEIDRTWTGPSDRSVTGFPFFGHLNNQANVIYAEGYSGNGVVQSFLGANILCALILKNAPVWQHCGLVNQTLDNFVVEPFRTVGAYLIRNAIRRKERAEDNNTHVNPIDTYLASLIGSAGKVDMKS